MENKKTITYHSNRKCGHCGKPIADQEHASRIYCPRKQYDDGSIENCKDAFWGEIKKTETDIYKRMVRYHKEVSDRLQHLYDLNLPEITLQVLDNTGIYFKKCLLRTETDDGLLAFYFVGYVIFVNPINNQLKINKHDEELF